MGLAAHVSGASPGPRNLRRVIRNGRIVGKQSVRDGAGMLASLRHARLVILTVPARGARYRDLLWALFVGAEGDL